MILRLQSSYIIISMSSNHEKSESSLILDLILFRPLSAWNLLKNQLINLDKSFLQIIHCTSLELPKNSFSKLSSLLLKNVENILHSLFNQMSQAQVLSSGRRKYTAILEELVSLKAFCRVACTHLDTRTIIDGVKKEKVKWVKNKRWP